MAHKGNTYGSSIPRRNRYEIWTRAAFVQSCVDRAHVYAKAIFITQDKMEGYYVTLNKYEAGRWFGFVRRRR